MQNQKHSLELETALTAAKAAGEISRRYYRSNIAVTIKADQTPVTAADVECEKVIRDILLERFPAHGFYGEETGKTGEGSEYLWLVDPIDGTKGFVRQYPFFSTQIALMRDGVPILGVSNGVMFDELVWAETGCGAWMNGEQLRVSETGNLAQAAVSTGNLKSLASKQGWQSLGRVIESVDRIRGYGDFYHYHLLAAGKIDAVIESDVNILDIAALSVIITEAGGLFTDLSGESPGIETTSVLAANAALHPVLLERFAHWKAD